MARVEKCNVRPSCIRKMNNKLYGMERVPGADERINLIERAGFGCMLQMKETDMMPERMREVANDCRATEQMVVVPAEFVHRVYGLPIGGQEVDLSLDVFKTGGRKQNYQDLMGRYGLVMNKPKTIPLSHLKDVLEEERGAVTHVEWAQLYILYGLGCSISPMISEVVNMKLYSFVNPLTDAPLYNWSKHVADEANQALRYSLPKEARKVRYGGNMNLVAMYLRSIAPPPPRQAPAMNFRAPAPENVASSSRNNWEGFQDEELHRLLGGIQHQLETLKAEKRAIIKGLNNRKEKREREDEEVAHDDGDSDNDDNSDDKDSDEPDNNPMEEVEPDDEGDGVDAETQAPGDEVKADIVEKSGEGDGVDVETQAPSDEVEAENVAEKSEVDIAKKVVEEADVAMATEKSGVDVTIADFVIEGDKVVGDVAGKIRNKDEGLIGSNVGISSPKVYISKKRARSKNV